MNKTIQTKTAKEYLQHDSLKNCDLLTFLDKNLEDIDFVYSNIDGVCFYIKSTNIYCVSTENRDVAKSISLKILTAKNCICKNKWDYEVFDEKFKFKNCDECYQYIYKKDENFVSFPNIKLLSKDDIDEIKSNFSIKIDKKELEKIMDIFNFYGYFINDKIVGMVGRHIDGEIGFLEVLEEYRKQGIATKLIKTIVNENTNIIPYLQVLISNYKSINLQEKLGATKIPTTVFWCYEDNF